MAQDRGTFQLLAETRLAEAQLLLDSGQPSGSYYLAGYAIECALKAKIAMRFKADEIPDRSLVNSIYTHKLNELLKLSAFEDDLKSDAKMTAHWAVISNWSEQARYMIWTHNDASAMFTAVSGDEGLLTWLLKRL